jgi:hypothetical protein
MPLEDFVKKWKVLPSPTPAGEQAGHVIEIRTVLPAENIVGIDCTDPAGGHAFNLGKYRAASNQIAGSDFLITINKSIEPKQIIFSPINPGLAPGSWTADDSIGDGGGENA